jgi:hypothetical protein
MEAASGEARRLLVAQLAAKALAADIRPGPVSAGRDPAELDRTRAYVDAPAVGEGARGVHRLGEWRTAQKYSNPAERRGTSRHVQGRDYGVDLGKPK